ncbi:F-box/kelch-repeat protein At3g23880-like isoform X1 [Silene latifolia]|uniref:F-box/kelch-repeat protein At3g23880-like isoform X1 n=1 Tax=Silene latifolia TaxID=37657 RepID=UPI003D77755C
MACQIKDDKEEVVQHRELPFDLITQNILTRLPIKSVVRFKLVSKLWYSTLSSSKFGHTHFKFHHPSSPTLSLLIRSNDKFHFLSCESDEQFDVKLVSFEVDIDVGNEILVLVGTCNGLVCLGSSSGGLFILWNPITHDFRKYLDPEISKFFTRGWMVTWGFGYVSDSDDYKIVRICKQVKGQSFRLHVFSVRFDKWRRIDNDSSHDFSGLMTTEHLYNLYRPGVLVNDTLYWMGGVPLIHEESERKIMSFNLALEVFNTFPDLKVSTPLTWVVDEECTDEFLCVVKGCLSKYGRHVRNGEGVITVLNGSGETEQNVLSKDVVSSACKDLIGYRGSDKIFIKYYGSHEPQLGVIDLSSRPWKLTPVMSLEIMSEIASYSASLISPVIRGISKDEDKDKDEDPNN